MKRTLLAILLLAASAFAQFTTVTSQSIYGGSGQTLLPLGQIQFQAVDANGNPINYQVGGGGQQINYPTVCTITNGVIQAACYVANVNLTNPQNVCFAVTVKDANNNVVLGGANSGYQCAQPMTSNSWCSTTASVTTCNFDKFVPNINGVPIAQLPLPTALTLGGIYSGDCPAGYVAIGYGITNPSTGLPDCILNGAGGSGVWGLITGTLTNQTDLVAALNLKANLASPALTGTPTAPTQALTDNTTALATDAYVQGQNYAPLVSPNFTGIPTVPTQTQSDSSIEAVNSAWVQGHGYAPLASPAFTGNPTAPTQTLTDNSTKIATDAFVLNQGYAPLASPAFTGTPTAPTPVTADSSTKLATTAWVNAQGYGTATGNVSGPVSSVLNDITLFGGTNGKSIVDAGFGFPLSPAHIGTLLAGSNGLAQSATTDATNATNISSGTLNASRLPTSGVTPNAYTSANITVDAFGRVTAAANGSGAPGGSSLQLQYNNAGVFAGFTMSGDCTLVPSTGAITCTKTNGTNFAPSATTDTTNATNVTSGTLNSARLPGSPVTPGSYTVASITVDAFGRITAASNGSAGTGNVTGPGSSVSGDIAGFNNTGGTLLKDLGAPAPSAFTDTTNAANIFSGTLPAARLPNPTGSTLGGVQSYTASANQFLTAISTGGVPNSAQPSCANLSGVAPSCSTDATNASNIGSGTLPAARIPATAVTPGSYTNANLTVGADGRLTAAANGTAGTGNVNGPSISGVSDVALFNNGSGTLLKDGGPLAASATTDTTNASNISSGTLGAARLPAFTGDVTSPAGSSVNTIATNAVTNAKAAQMAANSIKGNNTGSTANQADLTTSQVSTMLGLAPSATTDTTNASNISSGTLNVARLPASGATAGSYTSANITINAAGQVTSAANGTAGMGNVSGPGSSGVNHIAVFNNTGGTSLADAGLIAASATTDTTNASNISSGTLSASRLPTSGATAGSYTNSNVTIDVTGRITTIANGSAGVPGGSSGQLQYNLSGAFAGYTMSGDGTLVPSTGVLTVTKTNGVNFAPSATTDTTNAANISSGILPTARITTNSIANSQLAQMSTMTLKGNNTGGTANAADLTTSQVSTMLSLAPSATTDTTNATNITSGTLPAARIPATAVLAGSYTNTNLTVGADGRITAASTGAGATPGGTAGQLQINVAGTSFGGITVSQDAAIGSTGIATVNGSSAASFYLPVGSATAPGAYLTNTSRLGLYGAIVSNAWTVTSCTTSSGTATCTVTNTSGFPFSFHSNDYILTSSIGGGYDCSAPSPCILTAVNSTSSTISYTSAGTGTRTSGTVNLFALGIHGQKTLFDSLHSTSANAANSGSIQLGPSDPITSHDVTNNYDTVLLSKNTNAAVADTRAAQVGDTTYGATTAAGAPFTVGANLTVDGLINPMTSQGDLLSVNSSGGLTRIPVGANGSMAFANAGLPGYTSCVQFTGTQLNICVPLSVTQILVNGPLGWGSPLPPSTISTVGGWPTTLCTSYPCSGYIAQANGGLSVIYGATSSASSILGNILYDPGCTSGQVVTVATAATSTTPTVPGCASATGNMTGAASSTTGDVVSFADTTGKVAADSGVIAANIATNPASGTTNNGAKWSGTHTLSNTIWTETGNGLQPKENIDLQTNNAITEETTTAAGSYTAGLAGCYTASATFGTCASAAAALESPGVIVAKNGTAPQWANHGQVNVTSFASAVWTFNDYVCSDPTNAAYYVDNGSTPCPNGQLTIGQVDVTDGATATSHSVELNPTAGQTQAAGSGTIAAHNWLGNPTGSTTSVGPHLIGASDTGPNLTATDTGAANAYVICPTPAVTALTAGTTVLLTPANANTGASTINVCSLGAKNITKFGTNALANGDLVTTATYPITYDGTEWTLTSNQTGCPNCGNFTGTKTTNGVTYTPGTGNQIASSAGITMDSGHNFFNKYNNVATAGAGVGAVYGVTTVTGATNNTSVNLCATTCPTGQYSVDIYLNSSVNCATAGSADAGINMGWTDDVGAKSLNNLPLLVENGSTYSTTMPLGSNAEYAYAHLNLWSVTGNAITLAVNINGCTSGTATYGVRATATRTQ